MKPFPSFPPTRYCALLAFLCAATAQAQQPACTFLGFPNEWRYATAADYDSDDWRAFQKFTGVKTPWRVEGDFNGDGLPDVARVAIHTTDQKWMLGVEFGSAPGQPCATFQIAQGMPHNLATLPSLQVLPPNKETLHCHHAGQRYAVACTREMPFKNDALIVSDAVAASLPVAYHWTQWEQRTRPDGSPLMVFRPAPLKAEIVRQ